MGRGRPNPSSPFHGRVYAVSDDGSQMRFARTLDHGANWIGVGADSIGGENCSPVIHFRPRLMSPRTVMSYIVWIAGGTIKMLVSIDGGAVSAPRRLPPPVCPPLSASLPAPHGWPVLPGGNFRVLTVPTACVFNQTVAVAWDDFRESVSRIYYALSNNGGMLGPQALPVNRCSRRVCLQPCITSFPR